MPAALAVVIEAGRAAILAPDQHIEFAPVHVALATAAPSLIHGFSMGNPHPIRRNQ